MVSSFIRLISFFSLQKFQTQGSQYRIRGYTSLASGTIYFGYRLILVYRFGFTTIHIKSYIYIYIYIYLLNLNPMSFKYIQAKFIIIFIILQWPNPLQIEILDPKESIPYQRLYRFGQRYNIIWVPVNTGVPFWVYNYTYKILYIYIYIYIFAEFKSYVF